MDAATVLMTSDLELPENVVCMMADCPYDSPGGIIKKVCRDRKIPDKLAYPFIKLTAKLIGKFDLEATSAAQAVKQAKIPILLIHGEDDRFVPCQMSESIAKVCASSVKLVTIPNAGHGLCYMTDSERYERESVRFLWEIPELESYLEQSEFARSQR
jgi:fermentation-respiration switch protein FrsA (DUF1100 family)